MANKAKKSIVKYASLDIKSIGGTEESTLRIYGRNSADTIVEINVRFDDYEFPRLIKQMKEIAKEKVMRAANRLEDIKSAVND